MPYEFFCTHLLFSWHRLEGGRKISSGVEGHEGPVYALYAYQASDGSGTCLVTGGGDGKVKTWDAEVTPTTPTVGDVLLA